MSGIATSPSYDQPQFIAFREYSVQGSTKVFNNLKIGSRWSVFVGIAGVSGTPHGLDTKCGPTGSFKLATPHTFTGTNNSMPKR